MRYSCGAPTNLLLSVTTALASDPSWDVDLHWESFFKLLAKYLRNLASFSKGYRIMSKEEEVI